MGEVRVPARAKWRAQTQRAVENFPISGQPIERELIRGLALIKGFGARVRAERGLLDPDKAAAIRPPPLEVAPRRLGRRVPDRRVPDRLRHVLEHERQRGHRDARLGAARRRRRAPERRRQRPAVEQRPVPVGDPRRGDERGGQRPDPGAAGAARVAGGQGRRVRDGGEVRAHAPDGRDAGDPRAGVRRLRGPGRVRDRAAGVGAARGWPSCRWAAPRSAPGSTRRPGSRPR